MKTTRRTFLKNTAAVTALAGIDTAFKPLKLFGGGRQAGNPLAIPSAFTGNSFTLQKKMNAVWPGMQQTETFSLTGNYPGPLLKFRRGDTLSVGLKNEISDDVTIHWHGMELPSIMDGHPMNAVAPGAEFSYEYPIVNRAGTYFFHSHTHGKTAEQVFKGVAGMMIIEDEEEQALDLPRGEYDIPLLLQDLRFDTNKQIDYSPNSLDRMVGFMGDTVMVNGTPNAFAAVKRGTYRLRLINASNARVYKLSFKDGHRFHVIGSDGGLLSAPVELDSLKIAPAERYEILVEFSRYDDGSSVMLRSEEFEGPTHMGMHPDFPQGMPLDVLRFDVNGEGIFKNIPAVLSHIEKIDPESAKRVRTFDLDMTASMIHTINDKLYEMHRIDEVVPFGETEIWEFKNVEDDMLHPMHIHGVQFQIVSRNGNTDIPEQEQGWKDSFLLYPSETVRVILNFDKYEGTYLMHCHNLEHEDDGMMINFKVEKVFAGVEDEFLKEKIAVSPNPCDQIATLEFPGSHEERTLLLTNGAGRIFFKRTVPPHTQSLQIPVWHIASGHYFCTIGRQSTKLIVAR